MLPHRANAWWQVGQRSFQDRMIDDSFERNLGIVTLNDDAHIGQCIDGAASFVERRKPLRVARQRTCGGIADAALHSLEGTIEPDGDAVLLNELAIRCVEKRAAAQRHYRRASTLDRADMLAQHLRLDAAKFRLAASFKKLRDRNLLGGFDLMIEVEKTPAQTLGEETAYGGFPAAHEAHQKESGR